MKTIGARWTNPQVQIDLGRCLPTHVN
jgi:hypothetical protein